MVEVEILFFANGFTLALDEKGENVYVTFKFEVPDAKPIDRS